MGEEEFESSENISQHELLARKFEEWQKAFMDDVYSLYERDDEQRGNIAFENWKNRFLRFLNEKLSGKDIDYKQYLSKSVKPKYFGESSFQHFKQSQGGTTEAFLTQCIEDARKGYLDEYLFEPIPSKKVETLDAKTVHIPSIFISHSDADSELAKLLLELFRFALDISKKEIRCTSVDGYRLSGGADIDDTLKNEVLKTDILIALISEESLNSAYVLFELGARWGTGKILIPLLVPGMEADNLRGPIKGLNALTCNTSSQLNQLVSEVGNLLGIKTKEPGEYLDKIDEILDFANGK